MQDELVSIRLDALRRQFLRYAREEYWPAFRLAVIDAAAVKVDDGRGHQEPKSYGGDGPTYA